MAIINGIVLFLVVGASFFSNVRGAPHVYYEHAVEVTMEHGSKYRGNLTETVGGIPKWLRLGGAQLTTDYEVFVRFPFHFEYYAKLSPHHLLPNHDPQSEAPRFAEMHFEVHRYYSALHFEEFTVRRVGLADSAAYPPHSHIYVVKPGGPVFTAAIRKVESIEARDLGTFVEDV